MPSLIHTFTLVPTPNGWTILGLSVHISSNKNAKMHEPAIHVAVYLMNDSSFLYLSERICS